MISKISNLNIQNIPNKKNKKISPNVPKYAKETELLGAKFYSSLSFKGLREVERGDVLNVIRTFEPVSSSGLKGIVYKLDKNGKSYAIKVARGNEFSFESEAEMLKNNPLDGSQRLIDYFKDPVTNNDILVSNFVNGSMGVLESKKDFKSLMQKLVVLDEAGILHNDLNLGNILFDEDNVNLIDFGEGAFYNVGETYDEMYPSFISKTNLVNLEQGGIPDCILRWKQDGSDVKENFKNYLSAKSEFYNAHAKMLEEKCGASAKKIVDYEKNLAAVLANPSDKVVENEARRMDVLYTFEDADTAVNYTKHPKDAIRNWNQAILKAKLMSQKTENEAFSLDISDEERKYFNYQHILANKLVSTYKDWGGSTINWINGIMTKADAKLSEHERALKANKNKTNPALPNLCKIVCEG